ncbi:MAG: DNA mismatch repair endonuclease MutL [Eubacteriales bacterium]|nr:DNA mismatch repair endonuclease MutL [Eubacteriales bacterium]
MTEQNQKRIKLLDAQTANAIAAGEVVERPASVVKELIENSLDAGATKIDIEIENGGVKLIRISDNGSGIKADDLPLAFERHSTSKLNQISDLDTISSMGFRGEALASIAAVSKILVSSRDAESDKALELRLEAGEISSAEYVGQPVGTSIEVRELFYNTPARFKFLKSDRSETSYIQDIVSKLALVHPEVSFRLKDRQKELLHTPGNNDLRSVVYLLWGKEIAQGMHPIEAELEQLKLSGLIARADLSRHNRARQLIFVNQRFIQSQLIRQAIEEAGKTWFMKGRHPQVILFLELPGTEVDVNVHPQKTEVRFAEERKVFSLIYHALRERFAEISKVPQVNLGEGQKSRLENLKRREEPEQERLDLRKLEAEFQQKARSERRIEAEHKAEASRPEGRAAELPELAVSSGNSPSKLNQPENYADLAFEMEKASQRLNHESQSEYFIERGRRESALQAEIQPSSTSPSTTETEHLPEAEGLVFDLLKARLIGQAFKTYLIFELNDKLFLLDQHAAHERIIYEDLRRIRAARKAEDSAGEKLLVPQKIELDASELSLAMDFAEELAKEGFQFSSLGSNSIVLREIPFALSSRLSPEQAFRSVLELAKKAALGQVDIHDEIDHDMACKAAIKAHDSLSYDEMKALVRDLANCENPYHCPHGRPVITTIREYDLEKLFKRVV